MVRGVYKLSPPIPRQELYLHWSLGSQSFTTKSFVDGKGDADSEHDNIEDDDGKDDRENQEDGECASCLEPALCLGQLLGLD